jgi:hypothetical protein
MAKDFLQLYEKRFRCAKTLRNSPLILHPEAGEKSASLAEISAARNA